MRDRRIASRAAGRRLARARTRPAQSASRVVAVELHQHVDEAVDRAEQRELLQEQDPAVVREDQAEQLGRSMRRRSGRRGRVDDDRLAEEVVDHRVDRASAMSFSMTTSLRATSSSRSPSTIVAAAARR